MNLADTVILLRLVEEEMAAEVVEVAAHVTYYVNLITNLKILLTPFMIVGVATVTLDVILPYSGTVILILGAMIMNLHRLFAILVI
jgi:uncharacterized membrane protein